MNAIRIGIVGLGANTRLRHVPGLRACENVEIVAVCNRGGESTAAAAREFGIPKTYQRWQDLVEDDGIDAVVIGTWPYLHCPITLHALRHGKHVLTEARMARDAEEAWRMLDASRQHPELVTQIVPSPFGLRGHQVVKELIRAGFLGELRELVVWGTNNAAGDPRAPLHWRQSAQYSGLNMLTLGILHETLIRWVDDPLSVIAQTRIFTPRRLDPETGGLADVGTPDSVQVLTRLPNGACGIYRVSGVIHHEPEAQIHLHGSAGTLKYDLAADRLWGAQAGEPGLREIEVPPAKAGGWRVEQDFVDAIRGGRPIEFTDFASGARYMEFTEAVARGAESGKPVELPLRHGDSK